MAYGIVREFYKEELKKIKEAGLNKEERYILSPQGADIRVEFPAGAEKREVINFCANNYLGLAGNPELIKAAKEGLERYGFGMASVRFICGTQDIHKELERKISEFLGTEDTILYTSCFDANGGLFETLLDQDCMVISDELNHASIIDGIRLCKADRKRFKHSDMGDLEAQLKECSKYRIRMVATDGVFSMDGDIAKLDQICDLAEKYNALVMVDDSHATGILGKSGKGSIEYRGVEGRIDIITSTLGKALGGACGGFTSSRKEIIDLLRQRSRPYLFSNTLAPSLVYTSIKVLEILKKNTELLDKLYKNTSYFRQEMKQSGFQIKEGGHPICPIMLYNARLARDFAEDLYYEGIYVVGFSYPVVPQGQARIRVQISAVHETKHLDKAIEAFTKIGKKYDILGKVKEQIIEKYGM
ncbi:MAG: glycine C-acetyltransferase [candidate division Zixibacteria bacterium RBG_16_43_9]|nr:MAG: glycine C-acetyltransferase [candidate division Zixibacteria bacterium RBG_16_43_9]